MIPKAFKIDLYPRTPDYQTESHGSTQSQWDGETMEEGAREAFRLLLRPKQHQDFSRYVVQKHNDNILGDIDVGFFVRQDTELKRLLPLKFRYVFDDGPIKRNSFFLVEVSTTLIGQLKERMHRKAVCWWQLYLYFQSPIYILYLFNRVEFDSGYDVYHALPDWFRGEIEKNPRNLRFSIVWAPHFDVASWPKDIKNKMKDIEIKEMKRTINNDQKQIENMKNKMEDMKQKINELESLVNRVYKINQ